MEHNIRKIKIYAFMAFTGIALFLFFGATFWNQGFTSFESYVRSSALKAEYKSFAAGNKVFNPLYLFRALATENGWDFSGGTAQSIPVLVYHGINDKDDGSNINTTTDSFKEQMFALKRAGYSTIDLDQLYKFMRNEITLPRRSILITFDDGRVDSYQHADPVFKALGFKATMFVISGYSVDKESSYYISKEQVLEMEKSGRWDIEAHTDSGHSAFIVDAYGRTGNFYGNKLWLEDQNRIETDAEYKARISHDMYEVKTKLSSLLFKDVAGFAFPFGDFGQRDNELSEIILDESSKYFKLLFYQDAPDLKFKSNYPSSEPQQVYLVKRISVQGGSGGDELLARLATAEAKELPYRDDLTKDNGWIGTWGDYDVEDGEFVLKSRRPDGAGAAAVLDGTAGWSDYYIKTTLESPYRNSAYVWVRFKDDDNNTSCNIGKGFAHIEQVINGEHSVIRGVKSPDIILPAGDFEMEIRADGRNVQCYIDGRLMVETNFLDTSLKRGGIGFKVWDGVIGSNAVLIIKDIEVGSL